LNSPEEKKKGDHKGKKIEGSLNLHSFRDSLEIIFGICLQDQLSQNQGSLRNKKNKSDSVIPFSNTLTWKGMLPRRRRRTKKEKKKTQRNEGICK
jgi:hypothetical protein